MFKRNSNPKEYLIFKPKFLEKSDLFEPIQCKMCLFHKRLKEENDLNYSEAVEKLSPYFLGCHVQKDIYYKVKSIFDKNSNYMQEKDNYFCCYHDECKWIQQKQAIFDIFSIETERSNKRKSRVHPRVIFATYETYFFLQELIGDREKFKQSNLLIIDEDITQHLPINKIFPLQFLNSFITGSYHYQEIQNGENNVQLWFNHLDIEPDQVLWSNDKDSKRYMSKLYEISKINKIDGKKFGYIVPTKSYDEKYVFGRKHILKIISNNSKPLTTKWQVSRLYAEEILKSRNENLLDIRIYVRRSNSSHIR